MSRGRRLLLVLVTGVACLYLVLQGTDKLPYVGTPTPANKDVPMISLSNQSLAEHEAQTGDRPATNQETFRNLILRLQEVLTPKPIVNTNLVSLTPNPIVNTNLVSTSPVKPVEEVMEKLPNIAVNTTVALPDKRGDGPKNYLKPPKTILSPEQLLEIMGSAIGNLPVQNPKKVTHVIISTYFRSGSTFLGDILQQNWKTFYTFEPLHHMSDGLRLKDAQVPDAMSLLPDIMRCNFSNPLVAKYLFWASDHKSTFLIRRNRFLWVSCRMQPQLCFRHDFVHFICERAPWHVMKVNRLSLQQVGQLVMDNPDLDIRVVHLVRDPRGIMSSRKVLSWCNSTSCSDFRVLCNEMNADFEEFQRLRTLKPDRFFELRYEDLSINPQPVTKQLLGLLGVPFTNTVSKFLRLNTKAKPLDARDPYSTKRDSKRTPFEWRKKLKLTEVRKIQIACANVLKNYDYKMVSSSKQLVGDPQFLYSSEKPWVRN